MNLPSQFELFAQSFCEDLEKINQRVHKLDPTAHYHQPEFEVKPPLNPPSSRGNIGTARGRRLDMSSRKTEEDRNNNSLSVRINTSAKIVKPKRAGLLSPRLSLH